MGNMRNTKEFSKKKSEGRGHYGDLDIDDRTILS
jgi:hypothetical protein